MPGQGLRGIAHKRGLTKCIDGSDVDCQAPKPKLTRFGHSKFSNSTPAISFIRATDTMTAGQSSGLSMRAKRPATRPLTKCHAVSKSPENRVSSGMQAGLASVFLAVFLKEYMHFDCGKQAIKEALPNASTVRMSTARSKAEAGQVRALQIQQLNARHQFHPGD